MARRRARCADTIGSAPAWVTRRPLSSRRSNRCVGSGILIAVSNRRDASNSLAPLRSAWIVLFFVQDLTFSQERVATRWRQRIPSRTNVRSSIRLRRQCVYPDLRRFHKRMWRADLETSHAPVDVWQQELAEIWRLSSVCRRFYDAINRVTDSRVAQRKHHRKPNDTADVRYQVSR